MGVSSKSAEDVRVGDSFAVTIKRLGINGEGVGYFRRKTAFVPGALPGEVVKVKASRIEPNYIHAELLEVQKRSSARVTPACPVYEACGGCQLQHMSYEGQLAAKMELVREAFARYVGKEPVRIRPILGMDDPWGYRHKAQLQTGYAKGKLVAGLYSAGTHELVDISGCAVHNPVVNEAVRQVRDAVEQLGIPVYQERKKQGVLRTIVARISSGSGELQVTLVTATANIPHREELIAEIRRRLPDVATIAQNIHSGNSPLVFGEETRILWGKPTIRESLEALDFELSPRAFFQLNPSQTVKLYRAVAEAAELTGREVVVDAYCGTGTIGLWLAPHAREVRGIEVVPDAVEDARANARAAGFSNARFYVGRAEQLLPRWVAEGVRPDVVVADPPRTGCGAPLLQAIIRARPRRMIYVSCNPATLAKDCKVLLDGGYRVAWVQPVDMFPQTAHVECCVSLVRK